jgi:hypothetical protein
MIMAASMSEPPLAFFAAHAGGSPMGSGLLAEMGGGTGSTCNGKSDRSDTKESNPAKPRCWSIIDPLLDEPYTALGLHVARGRGLQGTQQVCLAYPVAAIAGRKARTLAYNECDIR